MIRVFRSHLGGGRANPRALPWHFVTLRRMLQLMTLTELADALKVSRTTLYRIRRDGKGFPPGVKVGSRYRWYLAEVQAWLERNRESFSDYGYMVSEKYANPRKKYRRLQAVA